MQINTGENGHAHCMIMRKVEHPYKLDEYACMFLLLLLVSRARPFFLNARLWSAKKVHIRRALRKKGSGSRDCIASYVL